MLDYLKILLPLIGGGLFGAFVNEWFRRRGARVQVIPLVTRVSRSVKADMKGFTLARITPNTPPEPVERLHEYQFTLRNTSNVHLQDAEIQFEFPSAEVEGWAERPSLSNAPLLKIDVASGEPNKTFFRWRIPQFPSTDSIDFTFRAVNAESRDFDVSLYKSERVVVKASENEVRESEWPLSVLRSTRKVLFLALAVLLPAGGVTIYFVPHPYMDTIDSAGCDLSISSSYEQVDSNAILPWSGPFKITQQIFNFGNGSCTTQMPLQNSSVVNPGSVLITSTASKQRPVLFAQEITLGIGNEMKKIKVKMYVPQN